MSETREFVSRFKLTIAYVILVTAALVALGISLSNQSRIERESLQFAERLERQQERIDHQSRVASYQNCEAVNESKEALEEVLRALAAPRPDDDPGDAEARQELFELVEPLIQSNECPPAPPYDPRFDGNRQRDDNG